MFGKKHKIVELPVNLSNILNHARIQTQKSLRLYDEIEYQMKESRTDFAIKNTKELDEIIHDILYHLAALNYVLHGLKKSNEKYDSRYDLPFKIDLENFIKTPKENSAKLKKVKEEYDKTERLFKRGKLEFPLQYMENVRQLERATYTETMLVESMLYLILNYYKSSKNIKFEKGKIK